MAAAASRAICRRGARLGGPVRRDLAAPDRQRGDLSGDTLPIIEYSHAGGNCSITGGFVYRGPTQTNLRGQYIYADFCSGRIWSVPWDGVTPTLRVDTSRMITSFGENDNGELYVVTIDGRLLRVLAS